METLETPRDQPLNLNTEQVGGHEFKEYPYRWAIVGLMGVMFIINGLTNNTIIPIASTLSSVYDISNTYVSLPITISFLIYSLVNFPANHIIDSKGLRVSLLLGASLFSAGAFCFTLINKGFFFAIFGAIFVALGQPFIINCPAKVATYWFFDHNRPFATSLMTGLMLIGTGIGFCIPSLVVSDQSTTEEAKKEVFYLYAGEFLASAIALVIIFLFMRKEPPSPPSIGAEQEKTNIRESFKIFKKNKNLWKYFCGFFIMYGTLLSFSSTVNMQMKPYHYTNNQISLFAIILLVMGVFGSIAFSLYLKKTTNYKLTIRVIPVISVLSMILILIALSAKASILIVLLFGGVAGFFITPIIPISYDLGCELSFPIGEAQVTGFLNGGSMLLAFIITEIITSSISFETTQSCMAVMIIYIVLTAIGGFLYFGVKVDLKRRKAEQEGHTLDASKITEMTETSDKDRDDVIEEESKEKKGVEIEIMDKKFATLNEEQEVYI